MIIFGFNHKYFNNKNELNKNIKIIEKFFLKLSKKYKEVKSIYLSYNDNKADIAI
jgi:hypothetical protein